MTLILISSSDTSDISAQLTPHPLPALPLGSPRNAG